MKAKKFELFMCCMGNGISVSNSAVTEYGDYKYIAHISETGNIKYYVCADYIPEESKAKIENAAENQCQEWEKYFSSLPDIKQYSYIMEHLPLDNFMLFIKDDNKSLKEKIADGKEQLLQIHF
nr:MAG TPA: hypothetical protein [Caudoviricetes sp.]